MLTVVLVIHLMLAVSLVAVVLLQKSEGGALGMGGGGMSGFMSGRSTANLLTRTTAVLAGLFMLTSIALALLAGSRSAPHSVIEHSTPATPPPASSPEKP
ncbi:MAG TPA: preprotein translocase subunit SecG [Stellaceae bacterium]|nr:preprotein translocase subunit SecG [Stellaceae bacterium]